MKIKAAIELTGLSDRTIRFYIEEGLISPSFNENYLGRKSFDFSDENIIELKNVAVLRKYDFTVAEIREILRNAETSKEIIRRVKNRNEQVIAEAQARQSVLTRIDDNRVYTVSELAHELSKTPVVLSKSEEDVERNTIKSIFKAIKTVLTFLVIWLPVVLHSLFFITNVLLYTYPQFHDGAIIFRILSILPTILLVSLSKIKRSWTKIARKILISLCVISLLCALVFFRLPPAVKMMCVSETTDFRNYLDLDPNCSANRSPFFHEFFPAWPNYVDSVAGDDGEYKTVYLDAHYYYRYLTVMDYTYDIYAEWPLQENEFYDEVARVTVLFEANAPDADSRKKYVTLKKGNYTCLALYDGDPVFEAATDNYHYYIFAYDSKNLKVRYINCGSLENGVDQPYYLSLDW